MKTDSGTEDSVAPSRQKIFVSELMIHITWKDRKYLINCPSHMPFGKMNYSFNKKKLF